MDKYVNVALNSSNGFNNNQTNASVNHNVRTTHTPISVTYSEMGGTMKDFNKRGSVQAEYRNIDLNRDKFNKTATSGFGSNF